MSSPSDPIARVSRLRQLLRQALALPGGERRAFVQDATATEPDVAADLLPMLPFADLRAPNLPELPEPIELRLLNVFLRSAHRDHVDELVAGLLAEQPSRRSTILSFVARFEALTADLRRRLGEAWRLSRGPERYELIRQLGAGGLGVVHEARDLMLHRRVAFKTIHPERRGDRLDAIDPAIVHRFLDEAQIAAQLQHPGIPPVHDLGIGANGVPFYTMRFIRGRSLSEAIRRPDPQRRDLVGDPLEMIHRIAEAVAHAHARGVLHRDLKSDNVVVGRFGEVCVVDWGLARAGAVGPGGVVEAAAVDRRVDLMTGKVGSFGYMAPEQARGVFTERGDVHGLAAILHELLVGKPPEQEPGQPVRIAASFLQRVDPRLAHVCRRGLAGAPEDRQDSVAAMLDDFARIAAGQDPSGFRSSLFARSRRWIGSRRRRPMTRGTFAARADEPVGGMFVSDELVTDVFSHARNRPFDELGEARGFEATLRRMRDTCSPAERYRCDGELGRGGMAVILGASDLLLQRPVAVKRMHEWLDPRDEGEREYHALRRWLALDEAQIQAQLDHPFILPVHEIVVGPGMEFLRIMPHVQGGTLEDRIAAGAPWRQSVGAVLQAAWGLAHAHHKGVVHSDFKPRNILIGSDGNACLADWEIAACFDRRIAGESAVEVRRGEAGDTVTAHSVAWRKPGQIVGTPGYMAPEAARGEATDLRSDVWSLGATLCQVITGKAPWMVMAGDGGDVERLSSLRIVDQASRIRVTERQIRALNPDVPSAVAAVCVKCLQQDPAERFPDAEAFARALQVALR